jgi:predicted  nucleic acid-binding Zn-ribbon protein
MLHINESIEAREYKTMNLFPLTKGHIPGSIRIDSTVLAAIFKIRYKNALSDNHHHIWGDIFKLNHRAFRAYSGKGSNPTLARQYKFAYMIHTDGVSVSLTFRNSDQYEMPQNIDGPLGLTPNPMLVKKNASGGPMVLAKSNNDDPNDEEDSVHDSDTDESVNAADEAAAASEAIDEALQLSYDVLCRLNYQLNNRENRVNSIKVIDIIYNLGYQDLEDEEYEVLLDTLNFLAAINFITIDSTINDNPNEWVLSRGVELDVVYTINVPITKEIIKNAALNNIKMKYNKKLRKKTKKQDIQYLQDIFQNPELVLKWRLDRRKIIGIDPGKKNLIECVDGKGKNANLFSYTYYQRRFEKRSKVYDKIRKELKRNSGLDIEAEETNLSTENSKSVFFRDYKNFFNKKLNYIAKVKQFYSGYVFRKLKLQVYQNTRKSEAKMINDFTKLYGKPEEVMLCIGDFEQRKHMKYRPPSIGASIRKIFRRHHFMIFLIDEFRTSMWCSHCGCENEKFMYHRNKKHRPKQEDVALGYRKPFHKRVLSHGLLRCKNVQECGLYWNRDVNGAKNIHHLASLIVQGQERDPHLSRNRNVNQPNSSGDRGQVSHVVSEPQSRISAEVLVNGVWYP